MGHKKQRAKVVKGQIKKLIDLPEWVVDSLEKQAEERRMKLKPYMEVVLIEQSKQKTK